MEGEKKRGRGWWALIGVIAGSVALYIGAYYALVRPAPNITDPFDWPTEMAPMYGPDLWWQLDPVAVPFFWPINQVDRKLRPDSWKAPPRPTNLW